MNDKSITIKYTAKTIDGQEKLWSGFGSGMEQGLSAKAGNYTISEFKASEIFIDCVEISKYVAEAEDIRKAYNDNLKGVLAIIDGAKTGKYVAAFKDLPIIEELRHALGEAICRADQEGYERAVKDQQDAIENASGFTSGGYVKRGQIYNGEIPGVVRPGEAFFSLTDEQVSAMLDDAKCESGGLILIDDAPIEPEERARQIAKQMISAALDEQMAKLKGGK